MTTQTRETQTALTPAAALTLLSEGNARFQAGSMASRDLAQQVGVTAQGQFPFAVILSCIDSRVSAELIFDQGLGDVFSARIAGNVLNDDILGSMEFACQLAGSKLIVVVGHSACGAVRGACDGAELGHLTGLLQKIEPAIAAVTASGQERGDDFVLRVAERNVEHVAREIRERSSVLEALIAKGDVGIVGAMYSVQTGKVEFGDLCCG